jgi:hypothetical protein
MFRHAEAERRSDHRVMENFYYDCIYDIVSTADPHHGAMPAPNHMRVKFVKLNSRRLQTTMSDTETSNLLRGEHPTLHQQIRRHKRNANCLIWSVRDGNSNIQTSPSGIATAVTTFFQAKYANIEDEPLSVQPLATLICTESPRDMEINCESPFTHTEIHTAITSGGKNRAPGRYGLGLGFCKATWPIIRDDLCPMLKDVFFEEAIPTQQKQRIIVCLPQTNRMRTPAD